MFTKWKVVLPLGIAAVIVLAVVIVQLADKNSSTGDIGLNDIIREQESFNALFNEIDENANEEAALGEIDGALDEAADAAGPTPLGTAKDPFELSSIQSESKAVGFDSGLDSFFSEETSLGEIDSVLSDF